MANEEATNVVEMPIKFGRLLDFTLNIGGKDRPAKLDLNTLSQVFTLTGRPMTVIISSMSEAKIDEMISIVFACLNQADPNISRNEVTRWLNHKKMNAIMQQLMAHLSTWKIEDGEESVAPYVFSQEKVVIAALQAAGIEQGHALLDIGCGEGHALLAGLKTASLAAVYGVELNAERAATAKARLLENTENGETTTVDISVGSFQEYPLPIVDVVYCYLLQDANDKLAPLLSAKYAGSTTKIVSVDFTFPFPLSDTQTVEGHAKTYTIYVYDMSMCLPSSV